MSIEKHFSRYFALLLLTGLILRIFIMMFSFQYRENTDVLRYRDWVRIAYLYDLPETYTGNYITFGTQGNNQPPGTLYILSTAHYAQIQFAKLYLKVSHAKEGSIQWINGAMQNAFLRFPSLFADILLSSLIYWTIKQTKREKEALLGASLFLFNPVVIYNSSFWGQMDAINNFLFYIAIVFLYKKRYFSVMIFFFLSLFTKLSLLFFFPILVFALYKQAKNQIKYVATSLLAGIGTILFLIIPISYMPHIWIINYLKNNGLGEMQNITVFAFNFWWLILAPKIEIGKPVNDFSFSEIQLLGSPNANEVFFGLTLFTWAIIFLSIALVPIFYKIKILKSRFILPENLFLLFSLIALAVFIFLPRMHERYMYPVFPLLATACGFRKQFIIFYILLSILNFLNVYFVWHPMLSPSLPYIFMNTQIVQWSISMVTILVFLGMYIKSFKNLSKS